MKRLIVNADDFGLTSGINRAIIQAHNSGIVTSASLMANSRAFDSAVELAKTAPSLSVGCHVVLIDGRPITPAARIPSLAPGEDGNSAVFRGSLVAVAACILQRRIRPEEVRAEAMAQIRRIQATGIRVSHFDSHKHTHVFPSLLKPLLQAAKTCGVRALRNPFAPRKPLQIGRLLRNPVLWPRYGPVKLLRILARSFRAAVAAEDMVTPDGTFGIVVTGCLTPELFASIATCIPEGTWEFVCHPGYVDDELRMVETRLCDARGTELEVLTSGAARRSLEANGVELISYLDLLAAPAIS